MECDTCTRSAAAVPGGFHCATCALSAIYTLRVQHAAILLDKESLGKRIEAAITGNAGGARDAVTLGGMLVDTTEAAKTVEYERKLAQVDETRERIEYITEKAKELRRQMEAQKQLIAERKRKLAQRRSEAESARLGLAAREARQLDELQGSINRQQLRHSRIGNEMANARVYLSREAAGLMRLRARKVRRDEGGSRYLWSIGSHEIPDMRSLNGRDPKELSAALNNVAHLVGRVSSYLAVRLPAEITLPHANYPLATILRVSESYRAQPKDVIFPGTTVSASGHYSPSASRTISRPLPSPRLLWVDKKLPQLAKEDTAAFARFVEGACLLAWDVAWLCKTQDPTMSLDTWEDVCPLGRNLYQLLFAASSRRKLSRQGSAESRGTSTPSEASAPTAASTASDLSKYSLGMLSHGTTHHFLGGFAGMTHLDSWKLKSPNEVSMKVRQVLVSEIQGAEWEMIDEHDEFDDEAPELIGGPARRRGQTSMKPSGEGSSDNGLGDSDRTIRARRGSNDAFAGGRPRGVNGWTKVKSRS